MHGSVNVRKCESAKDLYEEHGDTLALQYGGSCVVHSIEAYEKPGGSRFRSRNIVQTLSRYYSNNFSDFGKQQATNLFLRIFRPGAGSLPNNGCHGYPTPEVSAAISCREGGVAFLLNSDPSIEAHIHWTYAVSMLPKRRSALTAWYPRDALAARQKTLSRWGDWKTVDNDPVEANRYGEGSVLRIELPQGDPGLDWFSELYRPHDWTNFNEVESHQLPIFCPSPKPKTKCSLTNVVSRTPLHRVGSLPQMRQLHSLSDIAYGKTPSSDVTHLPAVKERIKPGGAEQEDPHSSDSDSPSVESFMVVLPQQLESRWLLKTPPKQSRKLQTPSDPKSPPPEPSPLLPQVTVVQNEAISPLLTKFTHIRLSELTHHSKRNCSVKSVVKNAINVKNRMKSPVRLFPEISHFERIETTYPTAKDLQIYKNYASIQFTEPPSNLNFLTVKPSCLKLYTDSIDLPVARTYSIPRESIEAYIKFVNG